ncbi:MAG: Rpn family recombination-promoting nuclease/putative transposase [Lachnospiraceae bacterium]|nr:Rpn family recombination-promoting nuclease/putative transposase [Lachnospiraceae bacterium]
MKQNKVTTKLGGDFASATGAIEYGFTNDYMFRAVLQENKKVLKALICALLHLRPDEVSSVVVTNPIVLGEQIDAKEFVLDINISLNNHSVINLEMQVENQLNWQDRSLSYLCRSYDNLCKGDDYSNVAPAIHIGFLDFTPFKDAPEEFYATYKLLNIKNHHLYSSKFALSVVNLSKINLATEEDKVWEIDYWARLFKATTWEEIKMIAKQNESIMEASKTLYNMHCEETIRAMARARQDATRRENMYNKVIADLKVDNEKLSSDNTKLSDDIAKLAAANSEKEQALAKIEQLLAEKEAEIARLKAQSGQD